MDYRRRYTARAVLALSALLLLGGIDLMMQAKVQPALALPQQPRPTANRSAAGPTPSCTPVWRVVDSPNPGSGHNYLEGVAAVSANDVWAVGSYDGSSEQQALVMHWDGANWTSFPSPGIGHLVDIAVISANDIWAVGSYFYHSESQFRSLTVHWDGATWSVIPSPHPGEISSGLWDVLALSSNDVWAVGYYDISTSYVISQNLVLHWDGTSWTIVPSPNVGADNNVLRGVTAISANDIWAVGYYSNYGGVDYGTLALHWDGNSWSVVPSPNLYRRNELHRVTAVSSNDVWAVGTDGWTLVEHWDGTSWSVVPSPSIGTLWNELDGVDALSANDIWAVGYAYEGGQVIVMHWDGTSWTLSPSPNPGYGNVLRGVVAVSANDVWAVGVYEQCYLCRFLTLTEHYAYPCVTPLPTATPTPTPTATATPMITPTPCSMDFTDVYPTDYFYEAVRSLYCMGAISGYADGTFRPYNNTTRAQLCKIIVLAQGWDIDTTGGPHFSDVPEGSDFYDYIETAYNHQIITGYSDGTFRPDTNIARGQLCKIVALAQGWPIDTTGGPHFTDVPQGSAFYDYIETAYNHQVINGYLDGTFRPGNPASRGQIAKVVYQAITIIEDGLR